MKKTLHHVPVIVHENAKKKALVLINEGYIQANETIQCSLCSVKYLFLCDHKDSGRTSSATRKHDDALLYFTDKISESHPDGHIEDVLLLPYELHMISSGTRTADTRSAEERKVS